VLIVFDLTQAKRRHGTQRNGERNDREKGGPQLPTDPQITKPIHTTLLERARSPPSPLERDSIELDAVQVPSALFKELGKQVGDVARLVRPTPREPYDHRAPLGITSAR
jgi:hypothetical protein